MHDAIPSGFEDVTAQAVAMATRVMNGSAALPVLPLRTIRGLGPEDSARSPIIKGLWGRGELSAIYGPPKSGKSFLVTSAALAVASGANNWHGFRVKQAGQVLYLVLEGAGGFRNRLDAWARRTGQPVPSRFARATQRLRFLDEGTADNAASDVARVKQTIEALERETGEPVVLVVIDTVARAMAGADENSAADMGRFLHTCSALQMLPSRPHVCAVHHAGKDAERGSRGSNALPAGVDVLVRVERLKTGNRWRVEWAKDDPETEWRGFALEGVDLSPDDDGDPESSCVVLEAEAPDATATTRHRPRTPSGTNQQLVWRALAEVEADPNRIRRAQMLDGVPWEAVRLEAVRNRAYDLADWPQNKRWDRFREAVNGLVAASLLTIDPAREWGWRNDA